MPVQTKTRPTLAIHGATRLPSVARFTNRKDD